MRPLDPLTSIKAKISIVIVAAVAVTLAVHSLGPKVGLPDWASAIAAVVLALGMVQFLARGMTSPLREMARATSAMATGDYSRRVTATSRDEVGRLAVAFNQMAADLHEVDRMRRDLVANVSHELRTPISALQAALENLIDGVEPPDQKTLQSMLHQVERLGRLVAQLLDLSRLESGAVPLQKAAVEARLLLEEAARDTDFKSQIVTKNVSVEVSVEPERLSLEADAERVHQVLTNLLDNAMRHSPDGGTIKLAARDENGSVRIEVIDEGPGINEEEASRLFERFYRSDHARSTNEGGTGLGLSIARWIVELHGGEIRAENRHEREGGGGCRMVVKLPR